MNRIVAVVAVLAFFLAACGVERSSEDALSPEDGVTASSTDAPVDGETDGTVGTDEAPPTTIPSGSVPTTGAPDDIALTADFGDTTWEITHGELNRVVVPTQENEEFVDLVFGGVPPEAFDVGVLTERLISEAVMAELAAVGGNVSAADLAASKVTLLGQVETLYPGAPDPAAEASRLFDEVPYLAFLVEYQAGQDALTAVYSETAGPGDGVPCVRHILVETESEGDAIVARLAAGEEFGELAIELSTGPSGPTGGDLGCAASSNYVGPFAEAVEAAELGAFVGPVETEFGWHVIVVDRYEVDGRAVATERLRERLVGATVVVDEKLGSWDADQLQVLRPGL